MFDPKFRRIYWTQKGPDNAGLGRIFRANVEIPAGQTAATRSDIEIFYDGLPEPIDLEIDHKNRILYWTDRGDPPRGNTVNRASIDNKPAKSEIVVTHLPLGPVLLDEVGTGERLGEIGRERQVRLRRRCQLPGRVGCLRPEIICLSVTGCTRVQTAELIRLDRQATMGASSSLSVKLPRRALTRSANNRAAG